jgi:response regulator of citrate/malate metabolism
MQHWLVVNQEDMVVLDHHLEQDDGVEGVEDLFRQQDVQVVVMIMNLQNVGVMDVGQTQGVVLVEGWGTVEEVVVINMHCTLKRVKIN